MNKMVLVTATILILFPFLANNASAAPIEFIITQTFPTEFYPSETIAFNITIKNIGSGNAVFVTAELLPDVSTPVHIVGGSKKVVGKVGSGQIKNIEYTAFVDETAASGIYDIPLRIRWKTDTDLVTSKEETLHFGLQIVGLRNLANLRIMNLTTAPRIITPGEAFNVSLSFKNIGGEPAELIKVKLSTNPPLSIIESDPEAYIPFLEPDEMAEIDFRIALDGSAESKLYNLGLSIEYLSRNIKFEKNNTFGVTSRGVPNIYIQEIIIQPSKLVQNKEGLLILKFINTGTENAEDAKIRITGGKGLLTESFNFIGEIKRDDVETASFGIYVTPDRETGVHALGVDITYRDKFDNNYSTSKIYEVSVFPKSSMSLFIIAAVALVSFSAAIYLFIIFYKTRLEKKIEK